MANQRGPSRSVRTENIEGDLMHAEADYIANAADVGSVGRGVASSGFTVGGSYVDLYAGLTYRRVLAINNNGADTLFVGPSGNGIANMYPIAGSGGQISLNVTSGVRIYGITDGTNTDVRIIEIG